MASGTDTQGNSGQAAIDRFAAMMIERMQQMKDTGMETGMDWRRIGLCRTAAECGWPQLFGFQFLFPSDAYRSHELPASGISDLQAGS